MEKLCEKCGNKLNEGDKFCEQCGASIEESNNTSNDIQNSNTQKNNINATTQSNNSQKDDVNTKSGYNPSAVGAFVCSLVGLRVFGIIMGIIAVSLGIAAKQHFKVFKNEKGTGLATAAIIIGCIDIVFPLLYTMFNIASLF